MLRQLRWMGLACLVSVLTLAMGSEGAAQEEGDAAPAAGQAQPKFRLVPEEPATETVETVESTATAGTTVEITVPPVQPPPPPFIPCPPAPPCCPPEPPCCPPPTTCCQPLPAPVCCPPPVFCPAPVWCPAPVISYCEPVCCEPVTCSPRRALFGRW